MLILCQHMLDVQYKKDIFFPHARKFHKMSPVRQNEILRVSKISKKFPTIPSQCEP